MFAVDDFFEFILCCNAVTVGNSKAHYNAEYVENNFLNIIILIQNRLTRLLLVSSLLKVYRSVTSSADVCDLPPNFLLVVFPRGSGTVC